MLKLNQNYSDYTDETDVDYPEGKAVNASTSESYDGTPLLAEFMNDVNAAHIAMYEKAHGSRDGISGQADTQKASQFADSVAKYTDDKVKAHADERGLADGVHGATSEATPGQIASRDEFGNLKVGAAINDEDAINKGDVEAMIKVVSAVVTPVGFVYPQFPGCPSPIDMKLFGTWEELKFGGVFFRSVGGDALPFTGEFKCVAAGNSIALNADDADTLEFENLLSSYDATKLIVIAGDEYRSITAWDRSTHTITLDSAFSSTNITTVLIGQHEGLPNIRGSATNSCVDNRLHTALRNLKGALCSGDSLPKSMYTSSEPSILGNYHYDMELIIDASKGETKKDGTYINDVYGKSDHLQTNNITVKYWKRIA